MHVVTHEYMPVNRTYRKSLCGLYYERVLQSYFEPFLKDELQRLDKLCGNSVLHKGFSDFWAALADAKKRALLQITMDEVLLNVKARLFSRDQPATYLAADVIFKAAHECAHGTLSEGAHRSLVGCTSLAVVSGGEGTVLRLERLTPDASSSLNTIHTKRSTDESASAADSPDSPTSSSDQRVMLRTHNGVMRMSNSANFVDVFRAQVADALDNVRALVKHLKPQSCDGTCLEAMGRQMLAVFAMCGMYITNVHPAYHEKLALQLQEDLIREEEEKSLKAKAKKAKQQEKKKKQQEVKAQKRAEEEEAKRKEEEEEKRKKDDAAAKRKAADEEQARKKAESRRKAQEEAERTRKAELEAEDLRAREEAERKAKEEEAARQQRAGSQKEEEQEEAVPEEEKAKRNHIAAIMRDKTLNPRERQLRIQAILAGKVDVSQAAAEDTPAPPQAGSQRHQQHQQAPAPRHHHQQHQQHQHQQQQHHQQQQQQHHQQQSAPVVHPNQQHHQQGRGMQQHHHHHQQSAPMVHPNQQHQHQQHHQQQQQQQYGHAQHQQQAQAQQQHALHAGSRSRQGPPLAPPTHGGDLDVEAFALGGINSALQDMARGDVDVMAMATGMMDPPNQNWGVGPHDDQAGIDSQNFAVSPLFLILSHPLAPTPSPSISNPPPPLLFHLPPLLDKRDSLPLILPKPSCLVCKETNADSGDPKPSFPKQQWDEFGVGGGAQAMPNMYAPFGASTAAPSGGSRLFERWGSRAVASDSSQGGRLG